MKIIATDKAAEVQRVIIAKKNNPSQFDNKDIGVVKTVRFVNGIHEGKLGLFESGSIRTIKAVGYQKEIAYLSELICFIELDPEEETHFV